MVPPLGGRVRLEWEECRPATRLRLQKRLLLWRKGLCYGEDSGYILYWLLFLFPARTKRRFFLDLHYKHLVGFLEVKPINASFCLKTTASGVSYSYTWPHLVSCQNWILYWIELCPPKKMSSGPWGPKTYVWFFRPNSRQFTLPAKPHEEKLCSLHQTWFTVSELVSEGGCSQEFRPFWPTILLHMSEFLA